MKKFLLFICLLFISPYSFSAEFYDKETGLSIKEGGNALKGDIWAGQERPPSHVPVNPRKDLPIMVFAKRTVDKYGYIHGIILVVPNPDVVESLGSCDGTMYFKMKKCNNKKKKKKVNLCNKENKNSCKIKK
jgi:hypothetical protein